MKFEVGADVIRKTTECHHNFSCLSTGTGKCNSDTEVFLVAEDGRLILNGPCNNKECAYYQQLDSLQICTCPTNYALHEKYNHHWKKYNVE